MARVFGVRIDIAAIEEFAEKVGGLDGDALAEAATAAVNETAEYAYDLSKRNILEGLSLTDAYVSRKMRVVPAAPSARPRAAVVADGVLTTLGHYGAVPQTQPVKRPKRSKGWAAAGIPPGQKQAGVSVEVVKGDRKLMPGAFILPDLTDNENNPLIFFRNKYGELNVDTGRPKVDSRLGPSVYQLFSTQIGKIGTEFEDKLGEIVLREAEAAFERAMK